MRGILIGVGLVAASITFVGETRTARDTTPEVPARPFLDLSIGNPASDAEEAPRDDMPRIRLSHPIRCEQWIAQWGPGEMARQRCVDADLRKRMPSAG